MNKSQRNFTKKKLQLSSDFKLPKKNRSKKSGIYLQKNSSFSNLKLSSKVFNNTKYSDMSQNNIQDMYLNSQLQMTQEPEIHIYKNRNFLQKPINEKQTKQE